MKAVNNHKMVYFVLLEWNLTAVFNIKTQFCIISTPYLVQESQLCFVCDSNEEVFFCTAVEMLANSLPFNEFWKGNMDIKF